MRISRNNKAEIPAYVTDGELRDIQVRYSPVRRWSFPRVLFQRLGLAVEAAQELAEEMQMRESDM